MGNEEDRRGSEGQFVGRGMVKGKHIHWEWGDTES